MSQSYLSSGACGSCQRKEQGDLRCQNRTLGNTQPLVATPGLWSEAYAPFMWPPMFKGPHCFLSHFLSFPLVPPSLWSVQSIPSKEEGPRSLSHEEVVEQMLNSKAFLKVALSSFSGVGCGLWRCLPVEPSLWEQLTVCYGLNASTQTLGWEVKSPTHLLMVFG